MALRKILAVLILGLIFFGCTGQQNSTQVTNGSNKTTGALGIQTGFDVSLRSSGITDNTSYANNDVYGAVGLTKRQSKDSAVIKYVFSVKNKGRTTTELAPIRVKYTINGIVFDGSNNVNVSTYVPSDLANVPINFKTNAAKDFTYYVTLPKNQLRKTIQLAITINGTTNTFSITPTKEEADKVLLSADNLLDNFAATTYPFPLTDSQLNDSTSEIRGLYPSVKVTYSTDATYIGQYNIGNNALACDHPFLGSLVSINLVRTSDSAAAGSLYDSYLSDEEAIPVSCEATTLNGCEKAAICYEGRLTLPIDNLHQKCQADMSCYYKQEENWNATDSNVVYEMQKVICKYDEFVFTTMVGGDTGTYLNRDTLCHRSPPTLEQTKEMVKQTAQNYTTVMTEVIVLNR